ncbi:MAG: ribosome maturation factor RimP [Lachnospiraceae bacterium]|nr:ribosome maturation factor RimP [Lachnospiraceae bacterium]
MAARDYEKIAEDIAKGITDPLNIDIYDVEYVKEAGEFYLRVYIDKPGGVTIDDCETVSRAFSDKIDEADPIPDAYILEVSSPGLGRKLKKDRHFEKSLGEKVEIKLFEAMDGSKEFTGVLKSYDADSITVSDAEVLVPPKNNKGRKTSKKAQAEAEAVTSKAKEMIFKRKEISTVRLVVEF